MKNKLSTTLVSAGNWRRGGVGEGREGEGGNSDLRVTLVCVCVWRAPVGMQFSMCVGRTHVGVGPKKWCLKRIHCITATE